MDDIRGNLESRAKSGDRYASGYLDWLKRGEVPVYVPRAYEEYPSLVEYPLEDVVNSFGVTYLNTTVAYAVAYAIHLGVKDLALYGADFDYPPGHRLHGHPESGRACLEFWLGFASARGVRIQAPPSSTLLDLNKPHDRKLYGYHSSVTAEEVGGYIKMTIGDVDEFTVLEESKNAPT